MDNRIEAFFNSIRGKTVAFIGAGVAHADCIRQFARKGAKVTVCDKRDREALGEALCSEFESLGVCLRLGEQYLADLDFDVIFRTPGMQFYQPALQKAREEGRVVTSELEVFFELCPCHIIGITGSDGKTTTSTLISELLKAQGRTVHLGGNIGRALLPIVEQISPNDIAVVELSSFQLISMRTSPNVAVLTNISPNHLDMHKDMQEYVDAKKNILLHQNAFSKTVLNLDNELSASMAGEVRGDLVYFSRRQPVRRGAYLNAEGDLIACDRDFTVRVMNRSEIRIPGDHNVENFLAAICATWGMVEPETIRKVAREFPGVEHRIEFVRELDGVKWYNDSIATSPTRTIAGLNAFPQKLILIAGGYDKKIPFLPLAPKILEKVKLLILTGATAQKIEDTVTSYSGYNPAVLPILRAKDLQEAVLLARQNACAGDVVTLSPACASFDAFPNFETRGLEYKRMVNAL